MILKIHSRCNLDCTYCYVYNKGDDAYARQPPRMSLDTVQAVAEMILEQHRATGRARFDVTFHGGEPLLVGKAHFRDTMDLLEEMLGHLDMAYSLQTNAVLVDEEWIALFERFDVTVGASLDGPPRVNRERRLRGGGDSTSLAVEGIRRLARSPKFKGVLAVVQPHADGREVVRFLVDDLGVLWFDLLLPDFTHDGLPPDWEAQSDSHLRFLVDAFHEWYPRSREGVSCRFFESVLARMTGLSSEVVTIGSEGLSTLVVETDGTLEPHDALRICHGFDRRTALRAGPGALARVAGTGAFETAANLGRVVAPACEACPVFATCRGGHLTHRYSKANGFRNPSVHCATLFGFLRHVETFLHRELTRARAGAAAP